jgi:prepilin-type processing-associated H-X9-DG protein
VTNANGTSWFGTPTDARIGPNWACFILPYVEQDNLFKLAQTSLSNWATTTVVGYTDGTWATAVGGAVIKTFQCPSDARTSTMCQVNFSNVTLPTGWARGNYAANLGPSWFNDQLNGGSASDNFGLPGQGPFSVWNASAGTTKMGMGVATIPDGSSNTMLASEVLCGITTTDVRGVWAAGSLGSSLIGSHCVGDDLGPNYNQANNQGDCADDIWNAPSSWAQNLSNWQSCPSQQATARSRHPGGVNSLMGDGSVRFIKSTIDQRTWYLVTSANDGQAVPNY